MFRFKLRTLLVGTALIAAFLGLQVYVHNQAKRFSKEMNELSSETQKRLNTEAGIEPESNVLWKTVF